MINLVPETFSAPPAARRRYVWRTTTLTGITLVLLISFLAAGGGSPGKPVLNLTAMSVCIVFVLAANYEIVVLIRALDELQQRLHILSWALGCALAVTVSFLWGLASKLIGAPPFDPIFTVVIAVPGYYISLFFAARHFA